MRGAAWVGPKASVVPHRPGLLRELLVDGSGFAEHRLRARAWGDVDVMVPRKLQIIRHGDVWREIESTDAKRAELTLDIDIESGDGFWVAARAEGSDGSFALTTPAYVVRPGLRFWKYEAVPALLDDRLSNLADIERMTRDAREQASKDPGPDPLAIQELARQSAPLLEEVARARHLYEGLRRTAENERRIHSKRGV